MINSRDKFIDDDAKKTLESHRREQEERKRSMAREQKERELKQLESQLFFKKEEIKRLKSLTERLKRESVLRQSAKIRETQEAQQIDHQVEQTEAQLQQLEKQIQSTLDEITQKMEREKSIIMEHERALEQLEKDKRATQTNSDRRKNTIRSTFARLLFFKKREEGEKRSAVQKFNQNQKQIEVFNRSLAQFNQEAKVLENKITAIRASLK